MRINRILLDMDDVLVDFVGGAAKAHARDDDIFSYNDWNFYKSWGIERSDFEKPILAGGEKFWVELEKHPWADTLIYTCLMAAPVTIATSPFGNPACMAGKARWLRRHTGFGPHEVMIGAQKHLMAKPDVLLIDDSDANVEKFKEAGGQAVIFSRPWNSGRAFASDPLGKCLEDLSQTFQI